jgi:hypothetical protein
MLSDQLVSSSLRLAAAGVCDEGIGREVSQRVEENVHRKAALDLPAARLCWRGLGEADDRHQVDAKARPVRCREVVN